MLPSELAKGPKITAYGIHHSTSKDISFVRGSGFGTLRVPNTSISNLFDRLRQDGVTSSGVEAQDMGKMLGDCPMDKISRDRSDMRYFSALYKRASRHKITLVPLENSQTDIVGHDLHARLLQRIESMQAPSVVSGFALNGINVFVVESPRVPQALLELEAAVSFARSMLMLKNARNFGQKCVITGVSHAVDMNYIGAADLVNIQSELVMPARFGPENTAAVNMEHASQDSERFEEELREAKMRHDSYIKHLRSIL